MTSLTQAVVKMSKEMFDLGSTGENLQVCEKDIINAAFNHIKTTHITLTHDDGGVAVKEVVWSESGQMFTDWSDNFWLCGPDSLHGKGKWKIVSRYDTDPVITALLRKSERTSKYNQVNKLWCLYWQILFYEATEYYHGNFVVDLHLGNIYEALLGKRPEIKIQTPRVRDVITV